jgi:hypothetical protein
MWSRSLIVTLALGAGACAAALAAGAPMVSSFLGAPAGEPVAFQALALPPVAASLPPSAVTATSATAQARLPAGDVFAPSLTALLTGNTVIRTEPQMRAVWKQLFDVPYDASLFDFDSSFVVLMGGGVIGYGSFEISAVEQVTASWTDPGGSDGAGASAPFLAVTSTTFLSGVPPVDPPSPVPVVSAVRIAKDLDADTLFHRAVILGI